MLMSFLPEIIPGFFGDVTCNGGGNEFDFSNAKWINHGCQYSTYTHSATTHWGYRHWLYFSMGVALFIVQTVSLINYIDKK